MTQMAADVQFGLVLLIRAYPRYPRLRTSLLRSPGKESFVAAPSERCRILSLRDPVGAAHTAGPPGLGAAHDTNSQFSIFNFQFSIPLRLTRFVITGLLVVACLCSAQEAFAQTNQISVDLSSLSPPIRSDAPMTFVWRIISQSSSLLDGQLDIIVHDGGKELGRLIADDVVLAAGEQLVRTVLPPIESHNQINVLEVHVEFHSKGHKLGAWDLPLQAPGQYQRKQVILVCDPWQSSLPAGTHQLVDRLRIETWNANLDDRTITTVPARARPEDLPVDSLGYCGFDVALFVQEGFAELKDGQLRPLVDWVAAGGSLCLAPGNTILKEPHVAFLNQVARAQPGDPLFVLESSGRLIESDAEAADSSPVLLKRYGLGRIAIVRGKLDRLVETREDDLRRMLAFLWKMRHDRLADFLEGGKFLVKSDIPEDKKDPNENQWQNRNFNANYSQLRPQKMQLASLPLQSGDQLVTRLMPEGLKIVPLPLIGIILVVYVLLIGPTDWFVLGAIRRRKWTWFTFPFVTVALTLMTVWLAEWYMQVSDNRRTMTFHDVGAGNQIARRNRFEVLFQGSERNVTTELSREIFSDMTLQHFSQAMWQANQQRQMQGIDQRRKDSDIAKYLGRVPSRYSVTQFLSQWTPQLNRRFTIQHASEKSIDFDWNKYTDDAVYRPETVAVRASAPWETIVNDVKQAFGPAAHVAVFANGHRTDLLGNFGFLQSGQLYGVDAYGNQLSQPNVYMPGYDPNQNKTNFLDDVSVNGLGGLFAVVSQSSPTGGKDFEDMALVDPSDPEEWLLVVAVDRGNDVDLYRKLYRKGD
jgi:hypothetical protein